MKKITGIVCILLTICSSHVFATSANIMAGNDEDGTKLNLWIPGLLIKLGGEIVEDHVGETEGDLMKKFGNITICIREGSKYSEKTDKKVTRKINKLDKKNYEPLVRVHEENTIMELRIKENKKGVIKKLVCIVDEQDETFVYLKVNCKLKPEDIAELISEMDKGTFN